MTTYPRIVQVVLDTTDCRGLAEFYRELFGLEYRPGDERPSGDDAEPGGEEWLVLRSPGGSGRSAVQLAFQRVDELRVSSWPSDQVPQQLHLDTVVASLDELAEVHERALQLGATVLLDRTDDPDEPLWVFADPSGHPFCVFVG